MNISCCRQEVPEGCSKETINLQINGFYMALHTINLQVSGFDRAWDLVLITRILVPIRGILALISGNYQEA